MEVAERVGDAGLLFVEAVVPGEGHHIEARVRQRIGDLDGRAEDRIARDQRSILDQNGLLIDAGEVVLLHDGADIVKKRGEVVAALGRLGGPVDAVVDQIVAHRHQRDARGLRLRLGRRFRDRLRLRAGDGLFRGLYRQLRRSVRLAGDGCRRRPCIGLPRQKGLPHHPAAAENDGSQQKQDQDQTQGKGGLFVRLHGHRMHFLSVWLRRLALL